MAKMVCFMHCTKLIRHQTTYGGLWVCPTSGCDVKCWEGPTSFPGTQEDFEERKLTHKLFDSLWRDENGFFEGPSRNKRRSKAYFWLSRFLQVDQRYAHIGMLRAEKCQEVRTALQELNNK